MRVLTAIDTKASASPPQQRDAMILLLRQLLTVSNHVALQASELLRMRELLSDQTEALTTIMLTLPWNRRYASLHYRQRTGFIVRRRDNGRYDRVLIFYKEQSVLPSIAFFPWRVLF